MPLLIKNGKIVNATQTLVADIWCEGETITRVGPDLAAPPGAEVIDATGKLVFPGFIDPHVHIHLPAAGTFASDNHASASKAALVGGTTTYLEMICPARNEDPLSAFECWSAKANDHSSCDYSFHMGVTRFDARVEAQLSQIVNQGINSFKVLLAYKNSGGISDEELYTTLRLAKKLGVITAAHCENADIIAIHQQELLASGKTGAEWHHESRPPLVEAEGVHHLLTFAGLLNAPVYIVHLSCEEALREAEAGRLRGVKLWIEVLIQHLLLDKSLAELPDFEGAKYVMSPPLRDQRYQKVLWNALRDGRISTLASDHAPFHFKTQKSLGNHDFSKIPSGLPGIEDRVNLLYSFGVKQNHLDLRRFVEVASTQPAKIFGLYPRKGIIQEGSDADLVIYDTKYQGVISAKTHSMNVDYNAFEGTRIEGRPSIVSLRGEIMARDGEFVGKPGIGRFIPRDTIYH